MDLSPQVVCIIVNWNGWQDTIDCIDALQNNIYSPTTIVVVDNGSTNDSIARIKAAHPNILLLESAKNLGFAGGNNIGIRYALAHEADYVWLLNNDTKPAPDALSALVAKALTDGRIGAVASICYYADRSSTVQMWAGARVNLLMGYTRNSMKPRQDNWFHALYGASMLISRSAIEVAGMLDEGYFHSWEETEFCLRLRKSGWLLAAAPESRVLHKVGASTSGNKVVLDRYFTTSGLRTLRLHSALPRVAMFLYIVRRFVKRLVQFQFSRCKNVCVGVRDYLRSTPIVQKIR